MLRAWLYKLIPHAIRVKLLQRQGLRKTLLNTFWLSFDQILFLLMGIAIGALVARYLGPDQYGLLGYAASFVGLFLTLPALGTDTLEVRALVRQEYTQEVVLGTIFFMRVIASALTFLALLVVVWQAEADGLTRTVIVITAGTLLIQPFQVIPQWYEARMESKYPVWIRNATLIFTNGLKVLFILASLSVIAFAWSTTLWRFLSVAGFLWIFARHGPALTRWRIDLRFARSLLRDGWPLVIAGLAKSINLRIDQVILGNLINQYAVGIYGAAVRISELWYFIPTSLAISLFPTLVRSHQSHTPEAYQRRVQMFYDVTALIGYAIAIFVTITADPLIRILFGPAYLESIPILRLHIWSVVFVCLGAARDRVLLAENKSGLLMMATVIGAVTNVALNYWLIPSMSGYGAAWATVIAYGTAYYFAVMFFRNQWPTFRQLTLALLAPFRLPAIYRSLRGLLS